MVKAAPDGSLRLDELAVAAGLHRTPARGEPACACPACRARRAGERLACLPAYLALLEAEEERDEEEIARVRGELRPSRPPGRVRQPWEPKPVRNLVVCREERPAA